MFLNKIVKPIQNLQIFVRKANDGTKGRNRISPLETLRK